MISLFPFLLTIFSPLQESIPKEAFVYEGKQKRERITVDWDDAPYLEHHTQALIASTAFLKNEEDILLELMRYVRHEVFDLSHCNPYETDSLIHAYSPYSSPEIPLEVFLEQKTGLCRHIALATTCLLQKLIDENLLKGTVYLIRDSVAIGRHAWTLFLSETGAWHLDSYWGVLEDAKTEDGFLALTYIYGEKAMKKQKQRWE